MIHHFGCIRRDERDVVRCLLLFDGHKSTQSVFARVVGRPNHQQTRQRNETKRTIMAYGHEVLEEAKHGADRHRRLPRCDPLGLLFVREGGGGGTHTVSFRLRLRFGLSQRWLSVVVE
jgi:hypothetical protein